MRFDRFNLPWGHADHEYGLPAARRRVTRIPYLADSAYVIARPYTSSMFTRRPTIAAARCKLPSVISFFGSSSRSALANSYHLMIIFIDAAAAETRSGD